MCFFVCARVFLPSAPSFIVLPALGQIASVLQEPFEAGFLFVVVAVVVATFHPSGTFLEKFLCCFHGYMFIFFLVLLFRYKVTYLRSLRILHTFTQVYTLSFISFVLVRQRGAEFSAPEMEEVPGTTMIEMVLALSAWTLARGGKEGAVVAPALAAVARNACPFLTAGMRFAVVAVAVAVAVASCCFVLLLLFFFFYSQV